MLLFNLLLLTSIIFILLQLKNKASSPIESNNLHEVLEFILNNGGTHTSHLNFLNDKRFYWAQNKKVLIAYQKVGRSYIILGDPIGEDFQLTKAIAEFEEYCYQLGGKVFYYQVSSQHLIHFQKRNYRFLKLGEEAKLHLNNFSLDGKKGANIRNRKNKFERMGYQFKVYFPPHSSHLMDEIKVISDSWLGQRKEKGFSVSFYCEDYISRFPVAILYDQDCKSVAFATLATNHQETNRTMTIDLMRYLKESPHGTMDMLFVSIFQWCKEHGYEWCSMGMSPLANLNEGPFPNKFERIGQFIFHKGNHFYNFKGLHEYKNKFKPVWESRYLVYRKSFLPILMIQLIWLIHQKRTVPSKLIPFNTISRRMKKAG
jgi:phosphatidylglycerol lysyltransferase